MLNPRCSGPKCRKPAVNSRHHWPCATSLGCSDQAWNSGATALLARLAACTTVHRNTATLSAISTGTITGLATGSAPATVRPVLGLGGGLDTPPSAEPPRAAPRHPVGATAPAHSTHW